MRSWRKTALQSGCRGAYRPSISQLPSPVDDPRKKGNTGSTRRRESFRWVAEETRSRSRGLEQRVKKSGAEFVRRLSRVEYRCVSAKLIKAGELSCDFQSFSAFPMPPPRDAVADCTYRLIRFVRGFRWISGEATGINDSRRQLLSPFQLETEFPKVPPFIFVTFHRSFSYTERERSALRTKGTKSLLLDWSYGWVSFFLDLSTNLSSLNLRWRCTCVVSQSP